jgi:hypothetical protein
MFKRLKSALSTSSRHQIAIKKVQNDVLVLDKNHYAAVLETTSINFELKSEQEQDLIIDKFGSFLNTIPQNLQFLIRIRELQIEDYLNNLEKTCVQSHESTPKLRDYQEFVQSLVKGNKILTRRFYIILPYTSTSKDFAVIEEQLALQIEIIAKAFEKCGMKTKRLESIKLLDLFYEIYNPHQTSLSKLELLSSNQFFHNFYAS